MIKKELLKLDEAMGIFNFTNAPMGLIIRVMKIKNIVEKEAEEVRKSLRSLSESIKPQEIEEIRSEIKSILASDNANDKRSYNLQMKLSLLNTEWNQRYTEGENLLMGEPTEVELPSITPQEFEILIKPTQEVIDTGGARKEIVSSSKLTTDKLAVLHYIINE